MFFDIGANIGQWTLANIDSCSRIISVEPVPNTFARLVSACETKQNVTCINFAVCNNNGEDVVFYESNINTLSTLNPEWLTSERSRFANIGYSTIRCKSIGIDSLIEQYGKPDLIKIDVEGGEYRTISSLTQLVDLLCFEWASELNDVTFACLDHLHNLGFREFSIQYEDSYTYRPSTFTTIDAVRAELAATTPKQHWGMIWARPGWDISLEPNAP
jgi:FkbM family methyltransferase